MGPFWGQRQGDGSLLNELVTSFPGFPPPAGRFWRAKMGRGIKIIKKNRKRKKTKHKKNSRMDLPAAFFFLFFEKHVFEFFCKTSKIDQKKKVGIIKIRFTDRVFG